MSRRAFTVVEVVMAVAVAALVIGAGSALHGTSMRLHGAPEALAGRSGLGLVATCLAHDLIQLGVASDQPEPIRVADHELAFYRTSFTETGIVLHPVRYRFEATAGRPGRLLRDEPGARPAAVAAVPLATCRFARVGDPRSGCVYLLVHLIAATTTERTPPAELSVLLPVRIPPGLGNPALATCTAVLASGPLLD